MQTPAWFEQFKNPPPEFRPVPFWSWNERMEPAEVRRQVDLLADAGLGGGFIHSRIGLTTPYLGEEWFAAVDAAIDQCRRRGLKVWLYDEDKWPSGFSGGSVPLADEKFRMKVLFARRAGSEVPDRALPIGPQIDGLQVYTWTAPLGHDWFNGTCYADLLSRDAMRRFLDDAYESYFRRYGELYGTDVVAEFTDEPCAIFRGRLPVGAVPFTTALPERFIAMHGYDPRPKLYLLFADGDGAQRFRLHYFRTVNDLFETNFTRQLGEWCAEHRIALTGHFMSEQSLYSQQHWGVKIMPNYRHQGIPGIDHLGRQIAERVTAKQCHSVVNQYAKPRMLSELYGVAGASLSFEDRLWIASQQICLGVNLLNHHLSLYTMAGCRKRDYPQNMFYPQPWWELNRVIDEPLSRVCVAMSQGTYHAEALIIHPQESAQVLWQSRVPAPEARADPLSWDREPTTALATQQIDALDAQFKQVFDALLEAQRTFDFGDETILADVGSVGNVTAQSGPRLVVGQMSYPLVILPSMKTIADTTIDLIERLLDAGGPVLRCGEPPALVDGEASDRLNRLLERIPVVEVTQLALHVERLVPPAVKLNDVEQEAARRLFVHVRDLPDGQRLVFLTNLSRTRAFDAIVSLRGRWRSVSLLDAHLGETRALRSGQREDSINVRLAFAPTQFHLLLLSEHPPAAEETSLIEPPAIETIDLPLSQWQVERLDDNALTLDYADWREGDGEWSTRPMPVIVIQQRLNAMKYDGPLTLRYRLPPAQLSPGRKLHLVVEYPERYHIALNGTRIEYAGLPFWRDLRWLPIDITSLWRSGSNSIELHCPRFQHGDLANPTDQFARYGTEIESLYLVGDFSIAASATGEHPVSPSWGQFELPPIHMECFAFESLRMVDPFPLRAGDVTVQGLPFYAGRIRLQARIPDALRSGPAQRVLLEIAQLDAAVAGVRVDDRPVGHFISHPLRVDLTGAIRSGGKSISITLYSTLRNLLGPHHHPEGEPPAQHPGSFHPACPQADLPAWVVRWMRNDITPDDWRDDYCMVSFGDLGNARLRLAPT